MQCKSLSTLPRVELMLCELNLRKVMSSWGSVELMIPLTLNLWLKFHTSIALAAPCNCHLSYKHRRRKFKSEDWESKIDTQVVPWMSQMRIKWTGSDVVWKNWEMKLVYYDQWCLNYSRNWTKNGTRVKDSPINWGENVINWEMTTTS